MLFWLSCVWARSSRKPKYSGKGSATQLNCCLHYLVIFVIWFEVHQIVSSTSCLFNSSFRNTTPKCFWVLNVVLRILDLTNRCLLAPCLCKQLVLSIYLTVWAGFAECLRIVSRLKALMLGVNVQLVN